VLSISTPIPARSTTTRIAVAVAAPRRAAIRSMRRPTELHRAHPPPRRTRTTRGWIHPRAHRPERALARARERGPAPASRSMDGCARRRARSNDRVVVDSVRAREKYDASFARPPSSSRPSSSPRSRARSSSTLSTDPRLADRPAIRGARIRTLCSSRAVVAFARATTTAPAPRLELVVFTARAARACVVIARVVANMMMEQRSVSAGAREVEARRGFGGG